MQTKRIEFRQKRDFSEKVSATFDFLRINFKSLARSIILIAGPLILIGIAIFVIFSARLVASFQELTSTSPDSISSPLAAFTLLGGLFIFFIVIYTAIVAVIYTYLQLYLDDSPDIGEFQTIFDYTKRNFGIVLSTTLFLLFLIFAFLIVAGILFAAMGSVMGTSRVWITVLFGFFVILPLFIYFAVGLSFLYFIRVVEGIGLWDSMLRSFSLISGHWWATFGYVIAITFIQGFMGYIFQIPLLVYSAIFPLVSLAESDTSTVYMAGYVVLGLFYVFGSQLLNAFNLTAIAFQYFNIVEVKEGVGLMNRIEKVGEKRKEDEEDF
jgi:hypothetical protein